MKAQGREVCGAERIMGTIRGVATEVEGMVVTGGPGENEENE